MPIRPSSAADVARLVDDLSSSTALQRETAVARLAVIGARAITKVMTLAADDHAAAAARVAALQALEAMADARALRTALRLGALDNEVGVAAIGVVGAIAKRGDARATDAFDWLAALAMDASAADSRRLAALRALEGTSDRLVAPIHAALADEAPERVAAHARRRGAGETMPLAAAIDALPEDPRVVLAMIREDADSTGVAALRRLLDAIRARERAADDAARRAWKTARGHVHQALAARGSRLGVYDLRETLAEAGAPLPVGFLAAAAGVGDATCLAPLAAAWAAAPPAERWWRDHLAEAFRAIVTRDGLTRRHPALKKILERQPEAGALVGLARR